MTARAPIVGACLALSASALLFAQTPHVDTSVKAVTGAASAYVEGYNPKMQNVLADEVAVQRVLTPGGAELQSRTTRADFFLTYLPADATFIAVRDVRDVDGTPVDDPDNIRVLIQRAPLWRLASAIAEKNSRFNIGAITRTFNEPTLALLVLTKRHRERFKFDPIGTTPGPHVRIKFKERDRPTLVADTNGVPAFSSGELTIDAATGRVEHTVVEFALKIITARIETTYAEDAKLKLWVPSVMRETYEATGNGLDQTIKCVSTYTNYRKFETSAIIK
jgi:hypothetical protein